MSSRGRPLSPHLSVYRWPVTMAASIMHRACGIALATGLVALAWWLVALSTGGAAYAEFSAVAGSLPGRICLVGWTAAFFYHFANGIRHLAWDLGYGFELPVANASAWAAFLAAAVLTLLYWVAL